MDSRSESSRTLICSPARSRMMYRCDAVSQLQTFAHSPMSDILEARFCRTTNCPGANFLPSPARDCFVAGCASSSEGPLTRTRGGRRVSPANASGNCEDADEVGTLVRGARNEAPTESAHSSPCSDAPEASRGLQPTSVAGDAAAAARFRRRRGRVFFLAAGAASSV